MLERVLSINHDALDTFNGRRRREEGKTCMTKTLKISLSVGLDMECWGVAVQPKIKGKRNDINAVITSDPLPTDFMIHNFQPLAPGKVQQ